MRRAHEIVSDFSSINKKRGKKAQELERLAEKHGVSLRQVQRWQESYKEFGLPGLLSKMKKRGGGGKRRLSEDTEKVITEGIQEHLMCRTPKSVDEAIRLIRSQCAYLKIKVPSPNAIRDRINDTPTKKKLMSQKGQDYANDQMRVSRDKHNVASRPLQEVQTDHSPLDLKVVDPQTREEIDKPNLTVILDVYTRAILGIYIGWEYPSFECLSYALDQSIHSKEHFVEKYGLQVEWPVYGLMESLDTDNAGEFDCENLDYFISENLIEKNFRPKGEKHYGGHVESAIGTIQDYVHTLDGTTFSNPGKKGDYNSEEMASLDLENVREVIIRWVVERYHTKQREELDWKSPLEMWNGAIASGWKPRLPDEEKLKMSLLPSEVKSISRHGILIQGNYYTAPSLTHWKSLETQGKSHQYRVHFNPADMRWVYFIHPDGNGYTKLPSTTIKSSDPVSLIEIKQAKKRGGRFSFASPALYESYQRNQQVIENARKMKKKARRYQAKKEDSLSRLETKRPENIQDDNIDYSSIPDWANDVEDEEC